MKYKQYLDRHNNGALSDKEWEDLTKAMLDAHFNAEKKARWVQWLAQNGIEREAPKMQSRRVWKLLAAASILFAVAVTGWIMLDAPRVTPAQRLAMNYLEKPFDINPGGVRGEKAIDINRGMALEAFSNREYDKAYQYMRRIETDGMAKASDYFQMGLCLMYIEKPDYNTALDKFERARRADPGVYTDEINWFSGLCHLMLGDSDRAESAFRRVADSPSSRNREAAKALLKALRK